MTTKLGPAIVLSIVATLFLLVGLGAFKNVVIAHPDGPRWVFLLIAVVFVGMALVVFTSVARLVKRSRP